MESKQPFSWRDFVVFNTTHDGGHLAQRVRIFLNIDSPPPLDNKWSVCYITSSLNKECWPEFNTCFTMTIKYKVSQCIQYWLGKGRQPKCHLSWKGAVHMLRNARGAGGGLVRGFHLLHWGEGRSGQALYFRGVSLSVIFCYIGGRGGKKLAIFALRNMCTAPRGKLF